MICFLPAIIIMCAIFFFSSQEANVSTKTSTSLGRGLISFRNSLFDITMSEEELEIKALQADYLIRKTAHATEYMVLSLSICIPMIAGVIFGEKSAFYRILIGTIIAVIYSISDEVHQLFVPGRSGQIKDVLIDCLGVIIGALIVWIISGFYLKKRANKSES